MTQIEKKYINFIQEAYQNPDLFTENDNNKFLEENEFLSAMIEEINIQMKKKTLDSFKRFSSNAAKLIQKTFGIATQTPKDPHLSDSHNIKKNFEKSSPSYFPEPRETFKPNDNKKGSQNEYHFQEPSFKPNSNEFGTFGGNDNKSGSAFQDFQSNEPKQDSFKAFGGGFDDGFKKVDTEAFQNNVEWGTNNSNLKGSGSGFDEFGLKTSKITHQNFEPIPEKIIKPALTNKSKLKRSSDAKDFDHEEPFSSVLIIYFIFFQKKYIIFK